MKLRNIALFGLFLIGLLAVVHVAVGFTACRDMPCTADRPIWTR